MARTLVVLPVSPFSERARWALDHHGLPYVTVEHVPFLGERKLRKLVSHEPGGPRATVPVLVEDGRVIRDSVAIARHADAAGSGAKLFPAGRDADIQRFVDLSERASHASRTLVSSALLQNPRALDATLPPFLGPLRALGRPATRYGTRWFARKWGADLDDTAPALAVVKGALAELRAALAQSSPYLLGSFSFADIVASLLLQSARPVEHPRFPLPAATREVWTRPELIDGNEDLIAWRDEIYRRHRG